MLTIKNFAEAHAALRQFYGGTDREHSNKLDHMRAFMRYLGSPQESLKIVHVAGTSGKTSTCYYISALLEAGGAKVGMTVSPHVDEVNERVQINRMPLPETAFCAELSVYLDLVHTDGYRPSYFELMVGFAFWEFVRQKVDYAVVEVGIGGLLDSTNVISRPDKVCVITDIGLDHTAILGDTLPEIATQKAGIIQPHNNVCMYDQGEAVMVPVRNRSRQQHATLHTYTPIEWGPPSMLPLFQQRNLHLATQAANFVLTRDGLPVLDGRQIAAVSKIRIPARMERRQIAGKMVIVDGAHNGQKLANLAASIRAAYPGKTVAVLAGFVDGEEDRWKRSVDALLPLAEQLVVTDFTFEPGIPKRAVDPTRIQAYCQSRGFDAVRISSDPEAAYELLVQQPQQILLVTGSFYLLNHIRPLLKDGKEDNREKIRVRPSP